MGVDIIIDKMDELVPLGLNSVLLFAVPDASGKEKVTKANNCNLFIYS